MQKIVSRRAGLLLIVAADLLWGTVFVASQVGLQYTNPYNLVFMRFLVASIIILAIALLFWKKIGIADEFKRKWTWIFGIVYMFGFLLQYLGQDLTTTAEATLLSNLAPIIVPFFAFTFLKEKISRLQKVAMALGLLGLFLVSNPDVTLDTTHLLGDLMLFGTSISYALFTTLSKKEQISSISSSFAVIITTTILLAPIAIIFGGMGHFDTNIGLLGWIAVIYLGIPCTLIAISIYLKGLGIIPASEASVFFLLQVLVGLILSAKLFGDLLNLAQAVGAVLIFAALGFGVKLRK
jgi:drug/metabolite transporter (DMT)-like permease